MADNYLEKKMEEHRRGGSPSYRVKLTPRGNRPGEWPVRFTPCGVFVADAAPELMRRAVVELAGAGFRVGFSMADRREGAALAQGSGARFYPAPPFPDEGISLGMDEGARTVSLALGARRCEIDLPEQGGAEASDEARGLLVKSIVWEAIILANLNRFSESMLGNIKIRRINL